LKINDRLFVCNHEYIRKIHLVILLTMLYKKFNTKKISHWISKLGLNIASILYLVLKIRFGLLSFSLNRFKSFFLKCDN